MKMIWKRVLCLVLCLCVVFSLAGCGEEEETQQVSGEITEETTDGDTEQIPEQSPVQAPGDNSTDGDKEPPAAPEPDDAQTPADGDKDSDPAPQTPPDNAPGVEVTPDPGDEKDPDRVPADNISVEDAQNVKLVQDRDTCPVKIISTTVLADLAPDAINPDQLQFTVQNKTGQTVTALRFHIVGYDERASKWVRVYVPEGFVIDPNKVQTGIANIPAENLSIVNGSTQLLTLMCNQDLFTTTRAIVTEYTLADGTVCANPTAKEWEDAVMKRTGVSSQIDGEVDNDAWRAMTELEKQAGPVKVTGMELVKNYYDISSGTGGNMDAIVLNVSNGSGQNVTGMDIYVVGYNAAENNWYRVCSVLVIGGVGDASIVQTVTEADQIVTKGATVEIPVACNRKNFTHAKAIVASYTTEDGTVHQIPQAQQWRELVK